MLTQRHEVRCTMMPPTKGPIEVPREITAKIIPRNDPLSRKGIKSLITSSIIKLIPPPPIPCTPLPAIIIGEFFAPPEIPLPIAKTATTPIVSQRRPKRSDIWPKSGWNAVLECAIQRSVGWLTYGDNLSRGCRHAGRAW